MSTATKIGHGLAKGLGIKVQYRNELDEDLRRGESVYSSSTADNYVEEEPRTLDWIREQIPTSHDIVVYLGSLFPFIHWIDRYNLQWLAGDLVAGITIGGVVVPQGMAYAALANLPVEYGLYTSFMGVLIYWFFATSKDITIGPVAVMSTIVGEIVAKAKKSDPDVPGPVIATALAVICGVIVVFIGLVRWGRIVDLISLTAISAFMTGSAINIAAGQVPALMGITGFNTRDSTYKVIINTLKGLPRTNLNAAMGLTALFLLYAIRSACSLGARKYPNQKKTYFFISTLRTVFVLLLYTLVSYLVNRHHRKKPLFKILGTVPRGFKHAAVPTVNKRIIKIFASDLPASVIVLLIEHIAISKSFGRINNYVINPSQELVAIGVTNILGPFLGGYPATGSFSRTAIKSKAGVRTPFAGVITAIVVLLAIYALPAMFFYIPSASLSAVIIHAVGDLITPPNTVYQFWRVSPLEVPIFFAGVFVTIFSSIENGIYTTISASFALLLFRLLVAKGNFLGKARVQSLLGEGVVGDLRVTDNGTFTKSGYAIEDAPYRNVYLPVDHTDGSNPQIELHVPYPGVFIYRFSELFNYPNCSNYLDDLTNTIFAQTRRTNLASYPRPGDRPWNDPGPRRGKAPESHEDRPTLKAIILDFASVNNVDLTTVQNLIDVRNQLDKYAAPSVVDWHFANIKNRWTKRALVAAGFGYPTISHSDGTIERWKPIFSVADIGGSDSAAAVAQLTANEKELKEQRARELKRPIQGDRITQDSDSGQSISDIKGGATFKTNSSRTAVVVGLNRPLFHVDITSALQSAIVNIKNREKYEVKGGPGIGEVP